MRTKKSVKKTPLIEPADDGDWQALLKRAFAKAGSVTNLMSELNRLGGSVSRQAVYTWFPPRRGVVRSSKKPSDRHIALLARFMGREPKEYLEYLQ